MSNRIAVISIFFYLKGQTLKENYSSSSVSGKHIVNLIHSHCDELLDNKCEVFVKLDLK